MREKELRGGTADARRHFQERPDRRRCPAGAEARGRAGAGKIARLRHLRLRPACAPARPPHGRAGKALPWPQADGSVARHRVRTRVLLRGARSWPRHRTQVQARHKSVLVAGADHGGRSAGHRLFQRQCRCLCRAHAAHRSVVAGSAQWFGGRACRVDRAARRRRPCGRQGKYPGRRGAAGDRLRPGRACRDRGAEDQGDWARSSRRIIRRSGVRWPKSSAPTSSSIPRGRSPMRPGPSTPR